MEVCAAGAVDGPRVFPVQRENVALPAGWIVKVDMRQALPAFADADNFDVVLGTAINDAFDDRVKTRDVAAAGEDTDFLRHEAPG
jgi:hypothetical protein